MGIGYEDVLEEEWQRWQRRDAKVRKRRRPMIVDGRGLLTVTLPIIKKKLDKLDEGVIDSP